MVKATLHNQVEWVYPDDLRVKTQTLAHHIARYNFVKSKSQANSGNHALDLACGTGYGTEILRETGYEATGIDISKDALDYANKHYKKCHFINQSVQKFYSDQKYDLITFFESLEHISREDGLKLFGKVTQLLGPRGIFVVSVSREPNPGHKLFHKSRWSYIQLLEALKKHFPKVEMFGQDWDTATISNQGVVENDFYIAVCTNS